MTLYFATEARFIKNNTGIYSIDDSFSSDLWERYFSTFEEIVIIARVLKDEKSQIDKKYFVSHEKISFIELPYYIGPLQYLKQKKGIINQIKKNINSNSAYICRVPGVIGTNVAKILRKQNISYSVEIVGDPYEAFTPGAITHPLRPILRYLGYMALRKVVKNACAALYVTESQLQQRYPVKKGVFSTNASNVQINDESIAIAPKTLRKKAEYKLVSVGSLAQMYKAPDVLIKAISILNEQGINCGLTWVGDGCYKWEMMNYANELGVIKQVNFAGNVSKDVVFEILKESYLYIHPSRTEGLPRAIIEAMSQGLPCIGTKVGGIPELLSERALIKKDDPHALAEKIKEFILSPNVANEEAKRNLIESHKYKESILDRKRKEFYQEIIKLSK